MASPPAELPPEAAELPPRVAGAVLCGGQSSRFGSDKALAEADGMLVGERVVAALRDAGVDPVAAIGGEAGPSLGLPTVPDLRPGQGPLGGLATALLWFKTGSVLVVPCDLVLLRSDHLSPVLGALATNRDQPTIATIEGEPQISLGCWPANLGRPVLRLLDGGERRFRAALDQFDWVGVEVAADAVADADTPAELASLLDRRPD